MSLCLRLEIYLRKFLNNFIVCVDLWLLIQEGSIISSWVFVVICDIVTVYYVFFHLNGFYLSLPTVLSDLVPRHNSFLHIQNGCLINAQI